MLKIEEKSKYPAKLVNTSFPSINKTTVPKERNNENIEKGKNITSVQPTVDEINRLLTAYGFENFRIAKAPNQENYYQIGLNQVFDSA